MISKERQIIKNAGFKLVRFESNTFKGPFGGRCNHVIGLQNANGEILHLDGKPYYPCGEKYAFASLIETGDINTVAFEFKKIDRIASK